MQSDISFWYSSAIFVVFCFQLVQCILQTMLIPKQLKGHIILGLLKILLFQCIADSLVIATSVCIKGNVPFKQNLKNAKVKIVLGITIPGALMIFDDRFNINGVYCHMLEEIQEEISHK